ncbi:MAG TPA: glucose-1-phosphate thymidylyltransferase [Coriobacteriia bacterium]|jgi:glucose-1-phosphate thymidylyltransferase
MKALVLAGGSGTRLRPITFTRAKQLVPVANKPILFYGLEAIAAAGITDVGIVVGETAPEVMAAVGDGSRWGLSVTYLPQDKPRGLAHAVVIAEEYMAGEPFVMYLGDNLIKDGITSLVREFESAEASDAHILLAHVPNPTAFGVAECDDGKVVRLVEKPAEPKSDLALVGVYLFRPAIFEAVNSIGPSGRGELEITDAIQWLVDNGRTVTPHVIEGWWKDTGKLDDLLEANRILLEDLETEIAGEVGEGVRIEGRVRIDAGAVVEGRTTLRGPICIGSDVRVVDSYIGPFTSLADGVQVLGSEIEHSIMLQYSRLESVRGRVTDSLFGVGAVVRSTAATPSASRFMVGDNSEVDIAR